MNCWYADLMVTNAPGAAREGPAHPQDGGNGAVVEHQIPHRARGRKLPPRRLMPHSRACTSSCVFSSQREQGEIGGAGACKHRGDALHPKRLQPSLSLRWTLSGTFLVKYTRRCSTSPARQHTPLRPRCIFSTAAAVTVDASPGFRWQTSDAATR